jgi:hypothetical protein
MGGVLWGRSVKKIGDREPKITCNVFDPSVYTDAVVAAIIAKVRLPMGGRERDWLQEMLMSDAIWYRADWQVDQREAKGQKSKEAWGKYIAVRLARTFERAFGRRATPTPNGPFVRFARAAIVPLGITGITANSIRDTLRRYNRR